ncbi:hypothetical protein, partial [Roseomonas sp. 18066]|uniref:hypothetical protein n=1 Tax=Roseomonas sp. 18066 TaxID=2681412 RepID=UPI001358C7EA
ASPACTSAGTPACISAGTPACSRAVQPAPSASLGPILAGQGQGGPREVLARMLPRLAEGAGWTARLQAGVPADMQAGVPAEVQAGEADQAAALLLVPGAG